MKARRAVRTGLILAVAALASLQGCGSTHREEHAAVPSGWPVADPAAVVSSSFGARRGGGFHQGIDLGARKGTPVMATADGTVAFAARSSGYGRTVLIDHGGGWQTRYAHLKRIKVEAGERVVHGKVIGTVGQSGRASGPHLHYEVLRNGVPVDPRPYLGDR